MPYRPPVIEESPVASHRSATAMSWALGMVGALVGACLGWFMFGLLYNEGFYALALPGAVVGLGFGLLSKGRCGFAGGVLCGVVALILMLMCEWHYRPWLDDEGFGYFFSHLHELTTATFLFLIFGVAMAFWFAKGNGVAD